MAQLSLEQPCCLVSCSKFQFPLNGKKFLVIFLLIFVQAMNEMNGKEIEGEEIEIVLAKPPDKKRKERQAARQASRSTA